jgi:RimJ/RimL family protein N-acetyltransferase
MTTVTLRPAALADADRLRAWRNDAETRRGSFVTAEVGASEHALWLVAKLADPDCWLWIGEAGDQAVSHVRLEHKGPGGVAEVSITVAPAARGAGIGVATLGATATQARRLGLLRLVAWVRAANDASIGAFVKAGYHLDTEVSGAGESKMYVLDL